MQVIENRRGWFGRHVRLIHVVGHDRHDEHTRHEQDNSKLRHDGKDNRQRVERHCIALVLTWTGTLGNEYMHHHIHLLGYNDLLTSFIFTCYTTILCLRHSYSPARLQCFACALTVTNHTIETCDVDLAFPFEQTPLCLYRYAHGSVIPQDTHSVAIRTRLPLIIAALGPNSCDNTRSKHTRSHFCSNE